MKQTNPVHRAGVAQVRGMGIRIAVGTDGGPGAESLVLVMKDGKIARDLRRPV